MGCTSARCQPRKDGNISPRCFIMLSSGVHCCSNIRYRRSGLVAIVAAMIVALASRAGAVQDVAGESMRRGQQFPFANPERVTIAGYSQDAMEPFITRDGTRLFFNNSNASTVNTNLFQATRIDDVTVPVGGEIG